MARNEAICRFAGKLIVLIICVSNIVGCQSPCYIEIVPHSGDAKKNISVPWINSTKVICKDQPNLTDIILKTTVRITGQDNTTGTGFIVTASLPNARNVYITLLVTASHVLERMPGEWVTISFNSVQNDRHETQDLEYRIKYEGMRLWTSHPKADIAVAILTATENVYCSLPQLLSGAFASDDNLIKHGVAPGDSVYVFGYPNSDRLSNHDDPVLRSGIIRLLPPSADPGQLTYLIESALSPGDSGGPVFISGPNAQPANKFAKIGDIQLLLGVVSSIHEPQRLQENSASLLIQIVPAKYIMETLQLVPYVLKPHGNYGITIYPALFPRIGKESESYFRDWYIDNLIQLFAPTLNAEEREMFKSHSKEWINKPSDASWRKVAEYLMRLQEKRGETVKVTICSDPNDGAIVKYMPIYYRTIEDPVNYPELMAHGSTPIEESMPVGSYYIWAERDGRPTSNTQQVYRVTPATGKIILFESRHEK